MLEGLLMNWSLKTFFYFGSMTIVVPIILGLIFFPGIADAKDITVKHSKTNFLTAKPKDTFFVVEDFTRKGDKAQLFVLEHGQCGGQDCKWSAQRTERRLKITDRSKSKTGNTIYYSMSIFIPEDFDPHQAATRMSLLQAKMKGVDMPLWQVYTNGWGFYLKVPATWGKGYCGLFNKGEWHDITVKADYGREKVKNYAYFEIWINGEHKTACSHYDPIVTKKVIIESKSHGWNSNTQQITMRYGLYRWAIGDYLYSKATKEYRKANKTKVFVQPNGQASIQYPFKFDWGHKVPKVALYYDEVRWGKSLEEVGIQDKAVDQCQ